MSIKARLVDQSGGLVGVASSPLPTTKEPRIKIERLHKTIVQDDGKLEPDGTYYHIIDVRDHDYHGFQWAITAGSGSVTLTFLATLGHDYWYEDDPDVSDLLSWDWDDVTNDLFGVANWTTSDIALIDTPLPVQYIKIRTVHATGAADDSAITIWMVQR
jgi:hypothetical protein